MKKVIISFDGTQFAEGAFEFAQKLNELQPILLTGVFMPQVNYASLWSYGNAMSGPAFIPLVEEEEGSQIEENIQHFKNLCVQNKIEYRIHKDFYDFALPELKKETRFADLLIISGEKFYNNLKAENAMHFLADALHDAECPVLVVPENFTFPSRVILMYDGSSSSVYAIKQFAYLFPELCSNETLLVHAGSAVERFPNEHQIEELVPQHYPDLNLLKLDVNPKKYFTEWINENKNAILVCGSFGRSYLSEFFKKSFVADVLAGHKLPVFIAHK